MSKKLIAVILIVAMMFTNVGMSTFAASISSYAKKVETEETSKEKTNYRYVETSKYKSGTLLLKDDDAGAGAEKADTVDKEKVISDNNQIFGEEIITTESETDEESESEEKISTESEADENTNTTEEPEGDVEDGNGETSEEIDADGVIISSFSDTDISYDTDEVASDSEIDFNLENLRKATPFNITENELFGGYSLSDHTLPNNWWDSLAAKGIRKSQVVSIRFIRKSNYPYTYVLDFPSTVTTTYSLRLGVLARENTPEPGSVTIDIILLNEGDNAIQLPEDSSYLFADFYNLRSFEYGSNVSSTYVRNMQGMFAGCTRLESISIFHSGTNTSKVTDMSGMFSGCENLRSLDLSMFNTWNCTTMRYMFMSCKKLTNVNLSGFNTLGVTDMGYMFHGCESLSTIDFPTVRNNPFPILNSPFDRLLPSALGFCTKNVTNMGSMFQGCKSLTNLDLSQFDTSNVKSMYEMFDGCHNLTNIDLGSFNTSNVSSMFNMFRNCKKLTSLDLTKFDTSNVTSMLSMFQGCSSLTSLDLTNFNTSKVTSMKKMFYGCSSLTSLDLTNFNTSKVISMSYMFASCSNATNIELTSFDSSNLEEMDYMFYGCENLTEIALWLDTDNVTNMNYMFKGCTDLEHIYVSKKFSTSSVTYSDRMFEGCASLAGSQGTTLATTGGVVDATYARYDGGTGNEGYFSEIPYYVLPNNWYETSGETRTWVKTIKIDSSKGSDYTLIGVIPDSNGLELYKSSLTGGELLIYIPNSLYTVYTDANSSKMFAFSSLRTLDLGSNLDTSKTTNMSFMFDQCTALTDLDVSSFDTSNVTNMSYMFRLCNRLTSLNISNFNTSKVTNMSNLFDSCHNLTNLDVSNFDTSNVTNMSCMFSSCRTLTSLDVSNFDTSNVTDMDNMFSSCERLASLNLNNFNTSNVTNMSGMFHSCKTLTSLDVSSFDTSNVTNMSYMFHLCSALTSLDVSNFNTSKVTNMNNMFYYCEALTRLDVTHFVTASVSDMYYMFGYCKALTNLDVSNFDTSNVTNMSCMFSNCETLTSADINTWDTKNVTDMSFLFNGCLNLSSIITHRSKVLNTSNVTTMRAMFKNCKNLDSIDFERTICRVDTSKVTDMGEMFYGCDNIDFDYLALNLFDTSNVINMRSMFEGCSHLGRIYFNNLPDKYWNTSKVTNMSRMFSGCVALGLYYTDLWYWDTSNVTTMANMFENIGTSSLGLNFFDTSSVTNMREMFKNCSNLQRINTSSLFRTTQVSESTNMFEGCDKLKGSQGTTLASTSNVVDATYAKPDKGMLDPGYFIYASVFTGIRIKSSPSIVDYKEGEHFNPEGLVLYLDQSDGSVRLATYSNTDRSFKFNPATTSELTMADTKVDISYARYTVSLDINVRSKKVNYVLGPGWYTSEMIAKRPQEKITNITISKYPEPAPSRYEDRWDIPDSNGLVGYRVQRGSGDLEENDIYIYAPEEGTIYTAENCRFLFSDTNFLSKYSSFNGDLDRMDTRNFFKNVQEINNLEYLDTTNTTNMQGMFAGLRKVKLLYLSSFKTEQVKAMDFMFYYCDKLREIHVSNDFNISNLESSTVYGIVSLSGSSSMFTKDIMLLGEKGTTYTESGVDGSYAHIDGGLSNPGYFTGSRYVLRPGWFDSEVAGINQKDIESIKFEKNLTSEPTGTISWRIKDSGGLYAYLDGTKITIYGPDNFDMYTAEDSSYLFSGVSRDERFSSLEEIENLSYLNTSNTIDFSHMFDTCSRLKNINLNFFDTKKAINMGYMFFRSENLLALDLSTFDTSNVSNMVAMFSSCENLEKIIVTHKFVTDSVNNSTDMFSYCYSIDGGAGTKYSSNHTTKEYARIDGGSSYPGYFRTNSYQFGTGWYKGAIPANQVTKITIVKSPDPEPAHTSSWVIPDSNGLIGYLNGTEVYIWRKK